MIPVLCLYMAVLLTKHSALVKRNEKSIYSITNSIYGYFNLSAKMESRKLIRYANLYYFLVDLGFQSRVWIKIHRTIIFQFIIHKLIKIRGVSINIFWTNQAKWKQVQNDAFSEKMKVFGEFLYYARLQFFEPNTLCCWNRMEKVCMVELVPFMNILIYQCKWKSRKLIPYAIYLFFLFWLVGLSFRQVACESKFT